MVLQEGAELILHGDSLLQAMHKAGEGWMDGWSEREREREGERERERTANRLFHTHKSRSSVQRVERRAQERASVTCALGTPLQALVTWQH